MRWLIVQPGPSFSVHDVYVGWAEALEELGQQVQLFNLDDRLTFYCSATFEKTGDSRKALTNEQASELAINGVYADLYKVRPDILLVISGIMLPPECYRLARAYGTRIVVIHTESPYEDDRQSLVAPYADVNLINDPTNLHRFPDGTRYVPHAYRPTVHHPGPPQPEMVCDLGFVGTGFESRVAFFEQMDLDGLDVVLAGNWWSIGDDSPLFPFLAHDPADCLDNAETADLYRSARVGMNLYRREAQRPELSAGWAMGPREVEMAACGLFFLRDPRDEGDGLLDTLPTFASPAEASELLRWWLAHPEEREEAALKARAAVADRTFHNHAVDLLRLLERK